MSSEAIGGSFSRKVAIAATTLVGRIKKTSDLHTINALIGQTEKDCRRSFSHKSMQNFYLILCGFSVINKFPSIYEACQKKLKDKTLGPFKEMRLKTGVDIRDLLNLTLQCTILSGAAEETENVLQYARSNTMLL